MTGYLTLYIIFIIISISYAVVVLKRYAEKLVPCIWNGKTNWNPNIDRFKFLLSVVFYTAPCILFNVFLKTNFNNYYVNYSGFCILIFLLTFCFWFDLKKINSIKEIKIFSKKDDTSNDFLELKSAPLPDELEKIKVKQDKIDSISRNIINKVENNYKKISNLKEKTSNSFSELENSLILTNRIVENSYREIKGLKEITKKTNQSLINVTKETKKNKSDFDEGFNEVKEKINQNKADSNKKSKENNNEISKIKDKLKPKNNLFPIKFSKFFTNKEIFDKVCTLLIENNFYGNKSKPKPIEICILIYKLQTLKIIDIYRKQGKICKSSASFFDIEEFDDSNLSVIVTSFEKETPIEPHRTSFKRLKYLNQLANKA